MHQCGIRTLSFQRTLCGHQAQLAKGPSAQCDDHQRVRGALASTKLLFCPISPYGGAAQKISDDDIIGLIHNNQPNLY